MTEHYLRVGFAWSDPDLLAVRVALRFQAWAGDDSVYTTRDELQAFAGALDALSAGGAAAEVTLGQPELGYAVLRLREYDRARHLALEATIGRGSGGGGTPRSAPRELRVSVPVERGPLARFAAALRTLVDAEAGDATLPLPADWP